MPTFCPALGFLSLRTAQIQWPSANCVTTLAAVAGRVPVVGLESARRDIDNCAMVQTNKNIATTAAVPSKLDVAQNWATRARATLASMQQQQQHASRYCFRITTHPS